MSQLRPTTVSRLLAEATTQLLRMSETPDLDSEVLLSHVLNQPKEFLFTHPEYLLTTSQLNRFSRLLARRLQSEPVAYLVGHKEFFGLDFRVNTHVLIPRPETELLVEEALRYLATKPHPTVVDVGTGSGVIAISVKKNIPQAQVVALDVSPLALRVARANAKRLKVNITYKLGSLLSPVPHQKFDCLISNPPYLTPLDLKHPSLKYEPRLALSGGQSGLQVYSQLLAQAPGHLNPGGLILLEIGSTQYQELKRLAHTIFPQAHISKLKDYAGLDRILRLQTD